MKYFLLSFLISFSVHAAPFCDGAPGAFHINPDGSQGGFVARTAKVDSTVTVTEFAEVCDKARVSGNAKIQDYSKVYGRAKLSGNIKIKGNARVYGRASLFANKNDDFVRVSGSAKVFGFAELSDKARVGDSAEVSGKIQIVGEGRVCEKHSMSLHRRINKMFEYCKKPYARFTIDAVEGFEVKNIISFDASSSLSFSNFKINYSWDFGNENFNDIENSPKVTQVYYSENSFVVRLKIFDSLGRSDEYDQIIKINPILNRKPISYINADIYETNQSKLLVSFSGEHSSDVGEGFIVKYEWDFGDGEFSNEKNPSHFFEEPGIYDVTLKVIDDEGYSGVDKAKIYVGCSQGEGDNFCPSLKNNSNNVINFYDSDTEFQMISPRFDIGEDPGSVNIFLKPTQGEFNQIDISSAFSLIDGRLVLDNDSFMSLVPDFSLEYTFTFDMLSKEGLGFSGQIRKILLGTSQIEVKVDSLPSKVVIRNVDDRFSSEILLESEGDYIFKGLPEGTYAIEMESGDSYVYENVNLRKFEKLSLEINSEESIILQTIEDISGDFFNYVLKGGVDINRLGEIKRQLFPKRQSLISSKIKSDDSSNFSPKAEIRSQNLVKESVSTIDEPLLVDTSVNKKLVVGYKLFTFLDDATDDVSIYVFESGRKKGEKGKKIGGIDLSIEDKLKGAGESHWESFELNIPVNVNNVLIYVYVNNTSGDLLPPNEGCGTGIMIDYKTQLAKPVASVKRIDQNGKGGENGYFPTTIDDKKINQNPYVAELNRKWELVFEVEVERAESEKIASVAVSVEDKTSEKLVNYKIPKNKIKITSPENAITVIENRVKEKKHVTIRIEDISKINFLGRWRSNSSKLVNFVFQAELEGENGKTIFSEKVKLEQTPLYDAKLTGCILYGTGYISMYSTHRTYSIIKGMLEDTNLNRRLRCNDVSMPFGGKWPLNSKGFPYHTSHTNGDSVDFRYFSGAPDALINKSHLYRMEELTLAVANDGRVASWLNSLRIGFGQFSEYLKKNKVKVLDFIISRGDRVSIGGFKNKAWNKGVIQDGTLPFFRPGTTDLIEVENLVKGVKCSNDFCSKNLNLRYKNDTVHFNHHHIQFKQ